MKDIHKTPESLSSELKTFRSDRLQEIMTVFAIENNIPIDEVSSFIDSQSLRYKKVGATSDYYSAKQAIRLHIANQASRIIRKSFGVTCSNTSYSAWEYELGKYVFCITYVDNASRYLIFNSSYDGKLRFETNSFKEFYKKIESLTKEN